MENECLDQALSLEESKILNLRGGKGHVKKKSNHRTQDKDGDRAGRFFENGLRTEG
jgi:hypothetical protein